MTDFIEECLRSSRIQFEFHANGDGSFVCRMQSDRAVLERKVRLPVQSNAEPTAGQLLYHLALQTQDIRDTESLDDWAEDMELDLNDVATQTRYALEQNNLQELLSLLGESAFNTLMGGLEISQAISAARPNHLRDV